MREQAGRHNRKAVRAGRVRLDCGSADRTGLPDACVDRAVSVNNVAIWPDLEAAVAELHRVVRPGGSVVIAWHGGTTPSRIARSLRLPEDRLGRIEQALRDRFGQVTRTQLASLDVFIAVRSR
jgi:SAM-dependent methyltransferase